MYPRNSASPERIAIGPVVLIADGTVQTSGVAVKVIPFGGTEASGTGTVAYSADGVVLYTPVQAETNYTSFVLVASKSGCIPASVTVVTTAEATAGTVKVGSMAANTLTASALATDAVSEIAAAVSGGLTPEESDTLDSIAVALAGMSPVEPTGVSMREQLNLIQSNTSSLSNLTASLPLSPGVIVGPLEPLVIGDDYTSAVGRQVRVNLLNSTGGSATTTFGSKSLSDAGISIQLLLRKSGQPSAVAQLVGTCTFFAAETVDSVEIPPYLLVSFSRTETAKATPGAYDMQAEAVWNSGEVVTFAPYGQVEFVRNIIRVS